MHFLRSRIDPQGIRTCHGFLSFWTFLSASVTCHSFPWAPDGLDDWVSFWPLGPGSEHSLWIASATKTSLVNLWLWPSLTTRPLGSNDKSSIHKAPTPGGNSSSPRPCSHWAPGCPCSKVTVRTICKNHPCDCMAEVQGDLFQSLAPSLAQNWVQQ